MRRKSERTSSKKSKSSPEKKEEKPKRTRASRRKKQSSSSENESGDEGSPERVEPEAEVKEVEPPKTPTKEVSPEESQDQVWHVKTPQGAGESGEITKLKICLARPPSTPERAERSPRSKRKHSRATSSSDTPSVEGVEEKRKTRHRSRKSNRGSNETERSSESHNEDQEKPEPEAGDNVECETSQVEPKQDSQTEDTAVSTTEENTNDGSVQSVEADDKPADDKKANDDLETQQVEEDSTVTSSKENQQEEQSNVQQHKSKVDDGHSQGSVDKSPESKPTADTKPEDIEMTEPNEKQSNAEDPPARVPEQMEEVSKVEERAVPEEGASSSTEDVKATNDHDVLELEPSQSDRERKMSTDSHKEHEADTRKRYRRREYDRSESKQSTNEETTHNGEVSAPIVVNRKRRWGSRPSKITSQKSITISTDVLKDIIPDVKPVEFNEVIEEKKHPKRIDLTEKIERPVLPKIVIDNTEHVELKKEEDEKYEVKVRDREAHPMGNRRISIIKENDVTERPPSPPRNVQSCILYITNLVRPFTLPQLKNLLQRTGRIAENGFWIDKIKSRCFVKYINEEQAVETRHALHGVTWPVSNPKTLHVDFSTDDAFARALNEETENVPTSTIPGTVEDWLREQDMKRERGDPVEKPWERKLAMREWDVGKGKDEKQREERPPEKRRPRDLERSPEPVKKFKKKEEEAPAKLLDDLFRKTKTTPCIYWLPLSDETIAVKEEQRRQHMAEHERRMNELRRRRH